MRRGRPDTGCSRDRSRAGMAGTLTALARLRLASAAVVELRVELRARRAQCAEELVDARGGDLHVQVLAHRVVDQLIERGIAECLPPARVGDSGRLLVLDAPGLWRVDLRLGVVRADGARGDGNRGRTQEAREIRREVREISREARGTRREKKTAVHLSRPLASRAGALRRQPPCACARRSVSRARPARSSTRAARRTAG